MTDSQYRTVARANLRNEPNVAAAIITTLAAGTIVHADPDRTRDGEWVPVILVRGWIHKSAITSAEASA